MTTVYWQYCPSTKIKWFELTAIEPELALPEIIKERDISSDGHFVRCPAFRDYYKNVYVIKSPIDLTLMYNQQSRMLHILPQGQQFFDEIIRHRGNTIGVSDPFLMSIGLNYLFIADSDCEIELLPAFMHKSNFVDSTRLIVGCFNIHKWYRPVEVAFEFKDGIDTIKIKRGDPLAYIKFITPTNKKVSLEYKNFGEDILEVVDACLTVKDVSNNFPLQTLYSFTERIRSKIRFSKCPWRK